MKSLDRVRAWWARRRGTEAVEEPAPPVLDHGACADDSVVDFQPLAAHQDTEAVEEPAPQVLDLSTCPDVSVVDFPPLAAHQDIAAVDFGAQQRFERCVLQAAAAAPAERFGIAGHCGACESESVFEFRWDGGDPPNWRESLACVNCGLINRWRAAIELFKRLDPDPAPDRARRIYLTEALTPVYQWFAARCDHTVGSEFIDARRRPGERVEVEQQIIRHEDVTRLSFGDGALAWVLSFDVLEHLPRYRQGLREFFRVLAPGGRLLLSVPFVITAPTTDVRARIAADGSIEHLKTPEYHQDPVREQGVLCYYHFGWDLLSELDRTGFTEVRLRVYWDPARGYLGLGNLISAKRP